MEWFDNNDEKYLIIKRIVKQEVENALEDRRMFLRTSLRSLIRSLLKDPNRFYAYYFNTPLRTSSSLGGQCIQDDKIRQDYEDRVIDEAEKLYSKTVENITNEVITSLGDNDSSISSFTQKEEYDRNKVDVQKSGASLYVKEEHTLFESQDKELEVNKFKELPEVQAGYRMVVPYNCRGQAVHPNFDAFSND